VSGSRIVRHRAPVAALVALAWVVASVPAPGVDAASTARTGRATVLGMVGPALPADPAPATSATLDIADDGPSIVYEQAMMHAGDHIEFQPGGRVAVGFTPRATDDWPVDGQAPDALPAGRATGRAMAASPQGSGGTDAASPPLTPDPGASSPIDAPASSPSGRPVAAASAVGYAVPQAPAPDLAAAPGLRRQVFGFLPYWALSGASSKLNHSVLSTIAYFSVGATAAGDIRKRDPDGTPTTGWGGWTSSSMTSVINEAHAHGTRVVLTASVFAWTSAQASIQKALLGSRSARGNLARQLATAVRDRGADGVNLDFEPLSAGYANQFVAFLRTLRAELNRVRPGYQLTYDTTGSIGNYPLEASVARGAADAIFVMGYDYRTSGASTAGSIDPLSGPTYDLRDTVRSYVARVDPSRVILGLPWYGRAWSTATDTARSANRSGAKYGYSVPVNYENIPDLVAKYGRRWDPVEQSPYVAYRRQNCTSASGCVTGWRQVYYDDGASLKLRLAVVNDYGLRGAGIWALGDDGGHAELYRAFADSFLVDKSAPQAGIVTLAAVQGDEGFVVTWVASDTSAIVAYDVQSSADGGPWAPWLSGTTATSEVWPGVNGHGYAFRVRARDSKGNTGTWNVTSVADPAPALAVGGFGRIVGDGLAYRAGPTTSAARLGTLRSGTILAITSGPVSADGATWFEVTEPVREWNPVTFVERGVWVAVRSGSVVRVTAYRAPNSTRVDAGIAGLVVGPGAAASGGAGGPGAASAARIFSPNGDGSGDTIRLRWTNAAAMKSLTLRVFRTDGRLVGSVGVPARAAGSRTWDWDGRLGRTRITDGRYMLQLVGTTNGVTYAAPSVRPATPAQVAAYAVTVDTVPPVLSAVSASTSLISPNGDGILDAVRLAIVAPGATRWTLRITDAGGTTVRTAAGTGGKAAVTWTGTTNAGVRAADGSYAASLAAYDTAGNVATHSWPITVDTTAPVIAPSVSHSVLSPNGDGDADTTVLAWTANEKAAGTARIYRGSSLVRSWPAEGLGAWSATWNGRTAAGAAVPDGRYTFRVSLRDAAGNTRVATLPVVVDRTVSGLRWSNDFFPQDRDALLPTAVLSWLLARAAATTLGIYDASGALVRTAWTRRAQAAGSRSWTWDGRLPDGSFVPQGVYAARLTVTSSSGTQALVRPVWVAGFTVAPLATATAPGRTISITFLSVEPIAGRPTVTFTQPGRRGVAVAATRLADGSYRATFRVAAGPAGAGSIGVSARDSRGGTNAIVLPVVVGRR
jgi:spore germination protein YaaH/flagellar hook assembly protein FlgD